VKDFALAHRAEEVVGLDTLPVPLDLDEYLTRRPSARRTTGKPVIPSQPITATSVWLREPLAIATTEAMPLSRK
jgi:hypothetical protein